MAKKQVKAKAVKGEKKPKPKKEAAPVEETPVYGTLYPSISEIPRGESGTMFMQMSAGTAKLGEKKYYLGTNMGNGQMIVTSEQTDRKFTVSWQDIIELAIARGIDGTDPIPNPAKKEE